MTPLLPALLVACSWAPPTGTDTAGTPAVLRDLGPGVPTPSPRPNFVVVVVDTLRAQNLGLYGYHRDTSPNLERWADDAVVFERAISQASWTAPSVSALLSGQYVSTHGVVAFDPDGQRPGDTLQEHLVTWPERLSDAGYRTQALVKSIVPSAERGYDQGFDDLSYVDGHTTHDVSGAELTDAALAWLDGAVGQGPFALYLHYMEPHSAYQAPEPYHEQFDEGYASDVEGTSSEVVAFSNRTPPASEADIQRLIALYDGEIAYLDAQLGRLFDHLESLGLVEQTVVAFVADHGEQFAEHDGWLHDHLFQENIHVPLALRVPGLAGRRVSGPVQQIDLAPTLLALARLEPPEHWQARDLSDALTGGPVPDELVFFEHEEGLGVVRQDGMKFWSDADGRFLYALDDDPTERENLASAELALAGLLHAEARAVQEQASALRDQLESADSDTGDGTE